MKNMNRLILNSAAHLLTDAVCAAALFGPVAASGADLGAAAALYNTLAFSTQCGVGLLTDRLERHEPLAAAGLAACALAALLPLPPLARVLAAGAGNSLFHVAAGTVTLKDAGLRAAPLGVFVAPGAVGLTLGTLYPAWGTAFAAAALLLAAVMFFVLREGPWARPAPRPVPWSAAAALLLAVAVRAVGGSAVSFPWRTAPALTLVLTGCVFAGKTAGGFLCDALGARRSALLSVPAAALLAAFCGAWMFPSLAGQLLLNLTMPVTLWLLYRAMPDAPGLAFGLAASALWPGTLLGRGIALSGDARWALILVCFAASLAAILYADGKERKEAL